jgi:hypothetical protein
MLSDVEFVVMTEKQLRHSKNDQAPLILRQNLSPAGLAKKMAIKLPGG